MAPEFLNRMLQLLGRIQNRPCVYKTTCPKQNDRRLFPAAGRRFTGAVTVFRDQLIENITLDFFFRRRLQRKIGAFNFSAHIALRPADNQTPRAEADAPVYNIPHTAGQW